MTMVKRMLAASALGASLLLGGCYYDDYGYGGVNAGYGSGGYGYDNGYAGGYGYDDGYYGGGYGYPGSYGWYGDFYYPGTGFYVFDRGGHRRRWNDDQRRYWESHRGDHGNNGRPGGWRGNGDGRPGGYRGPDRNGDGRPDGYRGRDRNGDARPDVSPATVTGTGVRTGAGGTPDGNDAARAANRAQMQGQRMGPPPGSFSRPGRGSGRGHRPD